MFKKERAETEYPITEVGITAYEFIKSYKKLIERPVISV